MKKTYLKPTSNQKPVEGWLLMQETSNAGGDQGNYSGGQLSRHRSVWDVEEEDEW